MKKNLLILLGKNKNKEFINSVMEINLGLFS
jgi:hypothetical protein